MAIKTYKKGSATRLSTNFKSTEFDCHGNGCCSSTKIDENLIKYLQKIRDHFGTSVNINSGYRCKAHNTSIGGASKSNHMDGEAADIRVNGRTPIEVAQYAESIGIKGIGVYSWGVHIDTRTSKYFWYDGGASNVATFGGSPTEEEPKEEKIDTSKVSTSAADPKVIWDFFKAKGLNDYGIAGLMGNLFAESGLKPTNLQNTYEKKLGYTDAEYTAAVDQGIYTDFVKDKAGYGLAQWTYWTRKQNLLLYAQSVNKSIGDLTMQLEFLYKELSENYKKSVLRTLCEGTSLLEASNTVLFNFESPANQSESVQKQRLGYSQKYYDSYATKDSVIKPEPEKNNKYTNSPLVDYTKISPNKTSSRNHKIDTITIHCVVGQCSVETLGSLFSSTSSKSSSNYGIGYDGKIGMYVEEKDRSWCSSNAANDHRAITIEVASDTKHPYAVNDKAYNALIELLIDICKRNDIKELKWKGDKSLIGQIDKQNMTVHRWFANKACPGDYLYERHGDIANKVNRKLNNVTTPEENIPKEDNKPVTQEKFPYLVKITASILNVRAGAGTNFKVNTQVKKNQVYTIVDEKNGWGKLKSGAGWISLDYVKKV